MRSRKCTERQNIVVATMYENVGAFYDFLFCNFSIADEPGTSKWMAKISY